MKKINLSSDEIDKIVDFVCPQKDKPINRFSQSMAHLFQEYEIDTVNRIAGFLAQTSHESGRYSRIEENLNYSAERLMAVFPKYFGTLGLAKAYEYSKKAIANRVYANRLGNGDENGGDGWAYRGRGLIQLTGKKNYSDCNQDLNLNIVEQPDLVLIPENAVKTAIWFWNRRKINETCDSDDIVEMTRLVQGGRLGLESRKKYYDEFKKIISKNTENII